MNKQYYIINRTSNIVTQIVVCDESEVNTLYPNDNILDAGIIEAPMAHPGCLYYDGKFWSPMMHVSENVLSHDGFRKLFTIEELYKIDNYFNDDLLTDNQKASLNSNNRSFELARTIDLNDERVIIGIDFLVSIGYITAERSEQIKGNKRYETI